jgi:hypothetical protein
MGMWKDSHAEWKQHWVALLHYHTQLERHALRRWRAQVFLRMQARAMRRVVLLRTARALLSSAFSAWRGYVRTRDVISNIQTSAVEHTNLNILKRYPIPPHLYDFIFSYNFIFIHFIFKTIFLQGILECGLKKRSPPSLTFFKFFFDIIFPYILFLDTYYLPIHIAFCTFFKLLFIYDFFFQVFWSMATK